MTGLIDSTEMYLRTLYELREEGITPLRARLVERLHVSAPAASESTARLASEGLVALADDRTVQFTEKGLVRATAVMRKHRLAELLLTKIIGLDWALVHNEACRWEHVISDEVEARLTVLLGDPKRCPFGNEIPAPLETAEPPVAAPVSLLTSAERNVSGPKAVTVSWISERLQTDENAMRTLRDASVVPGAKISLNARGDRLYIAKPDGDADESEISRGMASLVYVDH
ncbi:DtxR family transcriptional regulator, Mn-dependent transcriptional regulator [Parafrankia irregularis]|uniref:DtxR family transcriptional regulator, Mn-dependent transcriptional regulator n=1 Tax=Parafrankia irregularis TaxID=795642 RepID=A0A0S4QF54_9ACTN|nr:MULTISPECIES: metal-dependent transcriptional regulator [Frankiaceae]MBE3203212.1 metal-dependent transcriptional regulator [Parafrankia sp. CH37]CUU54144.1 DtxR family transcriptional regulator, Mn-dependent transcriptional regulator [Parafrankia irregularis]